ncbi:folylpolyglutamate synthase/dihydrofolate synthase family protein [Candidatus Uabimicrobium sp. HlEnr_7]|uniref:bifunctional folylpolyglutamate synthase/dihydrofolate synthase n=1 Tax=Candidatus Uabimicrobium helgolandensis TaxID=3095367 RepID=UPI00355744C6
MSSFTSVMEHLNQTTELTKKWDLQKIAQIINKIKNNKTINIQIVGTNGKGTTALFLQKILCAHGLNVGLFTSPHLVQIEERIRYNNEQISSQDFVKIYSSLRDDFDRLKLSYFEKLVAVAAKFYSDNLPHFVVWEAGLGGRLDATTAMGSDVVLFTPIAKDHTEYLGDSIAQITCEKFFVSQYASIIFSAPQDVEVREVMEKQAQDYCKKINFIPQVRNYKINTNATAFSIEDNDISIPMYGGHYAQNAMLAWKTAQHLLQQKFCAASAIKSLKIASWPGRLQVTKHNDEYYIFSCAHNVHSLKSDLNTLETMIDKNIVPSNLGIVFSITRDRPVEEHMELITHYFPQNKVVVAQANQHHPLAKNVSKNYKTTQNFKQAISTLSKQGIDNYLVIGSIYLVGEAYKYLNLRVGAST